MRVAIYTRKSASSLGEVYGSCAAQLDICKRQIAAREGWTVVEVHQDDGVSGATLHRPALRTLAEQIRGGHVDVVVVYRFDRLSRSLLDFAKLLQDWRGLDVDVVSVTEALDTSTPIGRLQLNMVMCFAEYEREAAALRTRDKLGELRARGERVGSIPYGYRLGDDRRSVVPDQQEQEAIDIMIEKSKARLGARAIATELERRGIVPRGKRWHRTTVERVLKRARVDGLL